ncbi:MAG: 30S ribosomal protein S16 [Rickettsiales bacterium]|nr:30S ribosomal protein S16 [Rickettsiales bacterium]
MATKIRFARHGAKKKPFYKLVVTDARSPRNGKFIERIGSYNPMLAKDHQDRFIFDVTKAEKWLSQGAIPSDKVATLFFLNGLKQVEKYLPSGFPKTEEARNQILKAKADKAQAEADAKAKIEADKKAAEEAEKAAEAKAAADKIAEEAKAAAEEAKAAADKIAEEANAASEAAKIEEAAPAEEAAKAESPEAISKEVSA